MWSACMRSSLPLPQTHMITYAHLQCSNILFSMNFAHICTLQNVPALVFQTFFCLFLYYWSNSLRFACLVSCITSIFLGQDYAFISVISEDCTKLSLRNKGIDEFQDLGGLTAALEIAGSGTKCLFDICSRC